jgi:hypothetical protein
VSNPVFGGPNDFHIEGNALQPGLGEIAGSRFTPAVAIAEPPDKAELRAKSEELKVKARQLSTVERELVAERAQFAADIAEREAAVAEREAAIAAHIAAQRKGGKS